nr:DAK2 domain-containing protein [Alkalibacter rhizosphaerae]
MQTRIIDGALLKRMLQEAAANLDANKKTVDDLNVFPVPDGDTGTNMSLTLQYASKELEETAEESVSEISAVASSGALMGARGNSGVILSQLLRGFAKACKGHSDMNLALASQAMKQASEMAYKAVMKPTEGTILTVARGMAEWSEEHVKDYEFMEDFLKDAIEEGRRVLDKTPDMLQVLKDAGVVDAGGMGLIFILEGALNALTGKESVFVPQIDWDKPVEDTYQSPADLTYGYCTEFIIIGKNNEEIREALASDYEKIGDSIIVVGMKKKLKSTCTRTILIKPWLQH